MRAPSLCALFFCLAVSNGAKSAPQTIVCPAQIQTGQVRLAGVPDKWAAAYVGDGIALNGASLMAGPPAENALLQPTGRGAKNEDVWTDIRPIKDGFWMACLYGERQDLILSQRLPDSTKECRIIYRGRREGHLDMDIRCR